MTKNRLNIKRSEFLSFVETVNDDKELANIIRIYKNKYNSARHICWAAVIDDEKKHIEQSSDAKEPRGTAGIQILSQIKSHQLRNIIVIVVRYFGGIQLGKKKLSEAYKTSAERAVKTYL